VIAEFENLISIKIGLKNIIHWKLNIKGEAVHKSGSTRLVNNNSITIIT